MGCDIHSVAQVKKEGQWITVAVEIADDARNYETFSLLAGQRGTLDPIIPPRGQPDDFELSTEPIDDASYHQLPEGIEHHGRNTFWMGYGVSSWYLLSELKAWQESNRKVKKHKSGFVPLKHFLEIEGTGEAPKNWCSSIKDERALCLNIEQYNHLDLERAVPACSTIYIEYIWDEEEAESTNNIQVIIDALTDISNQHMVEPDEVRYVFGFDS